MPKRSRKIYLSLETPLRPSDKFFVLYWFKTRLWCTFADFAGDPLVSFKSGSNDACLVNFRITSDFAPQFKTIRMRIVQHTV